jgi:hypothetical protein
VIHRETIKNAGDLMAQTLCTELEANVTRTLSGV